MAFLNINNYYNHHNICLVGFFLIVDDISRVAKIHLISAIESFLAMVFSAMHCWKWKVIGCMVVWWNAENACCLDAAMLQPPPLPQPTFNRRSRLFMSGERWSIKHSPGISRSLWNTPELGGLPISSTTNQQRHQTFYVPLHCSFKHWICLRRGFPLKSARFAVRFC